MLIELGSIGLGTFPFSNVFSAVSEETAVDIVRTHLACGGRYVETAPIYPKNGVDLRSVLRQFDRRSYVLGTKCGITVIDGTRTVSGKRSFLRAQVEGELRRLDLDYIDLLQTHVTPSDERPAVIASTMEELKREGLVRAIGVSNCTLDELREFCSGGSIEWIQMRLSMVHRYEYEPLRDFANSNGVRFNAFQVIERGQLLPEARTRREGDLRNTKQEYTGNADSLVRSWFAELSQRISKSASIQPESLALAWALSQRSVGCAVVGATSTAQVLQNWKAAEVRLQADIVKEIDKSFAQLEQQSFELYGRSLEQLRGVVR